jgi:hypothetical protein
MKTNRLLLLVTFTGVLMFGTSLYGQQEVDPSWYNPWQAPNNATAQQHQVAKHKNQSRNQAKIAATSAEQHAGKLRLKRVVVSRRTQS